MAGFQVNLNMKILQVYIEEINSTSSSTIKGSPSKNQEIIRKVLQANIVTNLRMCLDAYMTQNHLTSGEVCIFRIL